MSRKYRAFYRPDYSADTGFVASMVKLAPVAESLRGDTFWKVSDHGIPVEMVVPALRKIHDHRYVNGFLSGGDLAESNGFQWSPTLRDGVLSAQCGMLAAASEALEFGLSANIAQGFHHAMPDSGGGFCTFNGLALVASVNHDLKVCVLDCDEHGGNGTEVFARELPNLWNFTIFGSRFGVEGGGKTMAFDMAGAGDRFGDYIAAIDESFSRIREIGADLVIYQAGMDCHRDDIMSNAQLSGDQIRKRDRHVFTTAKRLGVPLMFVLAGGYQEMDALVRLHHGTFVQAKEVYGGKEHKGKRHKE